MRHNLILVFFLAICLGSLAIVYFLSKSSSPPPSSTSFVSSISPTVTPVGPVDLTYTPPSTWKTVSFTSLGISLCLPPDWSMVKPDQIVATIKKPSLPVAKITAYSRPASGSLQDGYLSQKVKTSADRNVILPAATVDQFTINNLPAIYVSLPGTGDSLVIDSGTHFYEFTAGDLTALGYSATEFQTNFYTMIGCLKPL